MAANAHQTRTFKLYDKASIYCVKNIVIIVLDDLGYKDLGSFGGELCTPCLDQLCNSAIKFTQFNNGGLKSSKGTFYEGGIRLANFLSGPEISAGVNHTPYHLVDIMPTVFKLLGLPLDTPTDGVNVFDTPTPNREFIYHLTKKQNGDILGAIRQGRYKLLKFDTLELYDLDNDPHERFNLAPSKPSVVQNLLQRLRDLAPVARWNISSNGWAMRPHATIKTMLPEEEHDTVAYALGLHGFTSIYD